MEYSKEAILEAKYREVNNIKNTVKWTSRLKKKLKESRALSFLLFISLLCTALIVADVVLIFNFVSIMQNML